MQFSILDNHGKITKNFFQASDNIFNKKYNKSLIFQVIRSYTMNSHKGTKSQKNRSEVQGGGSKPWKQKGTGKARAGTIRSPIWRSGGVTFAARKTKLSYHKINRKMYKNALRVIFSQLVREKRFFLIDNIPTMHIPKTSVLKKKIHNICTSKNILIIVEKFCEILYLSSRNLSNINICSVSYINPLLLIKYHNVIVTMNSLKMIEEVLS